MDGYNYYYDCFPCGFYRNNKTELLTEIQRK